MKILTPRKKEIKKDHMKLAGAYLPQQLHDYMTLYTLSVGGSKSQLIQELINNWMKDSLKSQSESDLLRKITERVHRQWIVEKSSHYGIKFDEYAKKLLEEMKARGLQDLHIATILKRLKTMINGKD